MSQDFFAVSGYLLAAFVGVIAIYFWRKAISMHALLVEAATRLEQVRRHGMGLDDQLAKTNDKLIKTREQTQKLEKAVDDSRQKSQAAQKQLEAREQEFRLMSEKLERQKDHYSKQIESMVAQLTEADHQRKEATTQLDTVLRNFEDRVAAIRNPLEQRLKEEKARSQNLEKDLMALRQEHASLSEKLKTADPVELKDMKRKAAQYQRLYISMRGLREMAEDRNRNWEVALRRLSSWIVEQKNNAAPDPTAPLGPLVGEALEKIGAQLVTGDFPHETTEPPSELT